MTTAAAKATAGALLAWLHDQPPVLSNSSRRGLPDAAPAGPPPGATDAPQAERAGVGGVAVALAPAWQNNPGAARGPPCGPPAPLPRVAPLRLAHADWLHHRLVVAGPDAALAAFRATAAGAGAIPWQLDRDRLEEDFFHGLAAPPAPQQRTLSLAGARILAGQLRDAVARRHDLAVCRVGHSRACPFDLHALVPVPGEILRRGPDDPLALAGLW